MKDLFLGGVCNSKWREDLKVLLKKYNLTYHDPIIKDDLEWGEEYRELENKAKEDSRFILIVLTPEGSGLYSIAEAVDMSNKNPKSVIFCFIDKVYGVYDKDIIESLRAIQNLIIWNGGYSCNDLESVVNIALGKRVISFEKGKLIPFK